MYFSTSSKFLVIVVFIVNSLHLSWSSESNDGSTMIGQLTHGFEPEDWEPVKHQTNLGTIEGRREASVGSNSINQHYYAFRGIPYADAPIGNLRFADPIDATKPWDNSYLNASRLRSACPQYDNVAQMVVGDEDCLFLNVFTPSLPDNKANDEDGLPVLFFIHGGGYIRGSSSVHPGARLAGLDIVVVTINYRLGLLGFLSTEDEVIPGNFGALDQVSALRWVHRNIAQYGGDPQKVTIGGFSAGAAFSNLHMYSPLSRGLFRSILIMSGSASCQWGTTRSPQENKEILAKQLNCPYHSNKDLKSCLTSKTKDELLKAQAAVLRYEYWPVPYAVTIDSKFRSNPFLPNSLQALSPANVPILIGEVPQEGIVFALGIILTSNEPTNTESTYNQVVQDAISGMWYRSEKAKLVGETAETYYYNQHSKESINALFEMLSEAMTDYLFHHCISDMAKRLAHNGNSVYTYLFTHRDSQSPIWSAPVYKRGKSLGIDSPLLDTGVSHGDNLNFLFSRSTLDPTNERVAHFFASNVAHFVTHGSPAVHKKDWPPIEPGKSLVFYNISTEPHMMQTPFREKEANFWQQTIPFVEERAAKKDGQSYASWIGGAILTYIIISLTNRER